MPDQTHFDSDLHHWNGGRVSHADQIVSRTGKGKDPIYLAHSTMSHLAHERDRLQPAEAFFDPLPLSLADGITRMTPRATINRAAATPFLVLRHVRHNPEISALGHKPERVKPFVSAHGHRLLPGICSSITSPASRSAVPLAWNTSASTINPWRFSTNRSLLHSARRACCRFQLPRVWPF